MLTLADLTDRRLSYRQVGATGHALPADSHHLARDIAIGRGSTTFEQAAEALMTWQIQRGAGFEVSATATRAAPGVNVLLVRPLLPGSRGGLVAPCRVVHTVEQPDRIGFTYGTLEGHPLSGEESFNVLLGADGTVRFVLIGFVRPANPGLRAMGGLGRMFVARASERMADRYARALTASVGRR